MIKVIFKKANEKVKEKPLICCHQSSKKEENKVVTYTCRNSKNIIPIIQSCQDELGIKYPLEYLHV